jgi:lipopolysaccharide export system permease protein
MSSFGFSEARIIGAVLKLCVPVVAALFLMAQFVIPPAQLRAQRVQASALGNTVPGLANGGFWARQGGTFLNVKQFSGGDT